MAEVVLFHRAGALTGGMTAFADELRAAGRTAHTSTLQGLECRAITSPKPTPGRDDPVGDGRRRRGRQEGGRCVRCRGAQPSAKPVDAAGQPQRGWKNTTPATAHSGPRLLRIKTQGLRKDLVPAAGEAYPRRRPDGTAD